MPSTRIAYFDVDEIGICGWGSGAVAAAEYF